MKRILLLALLVTSFVKAQVFSENFNLNSLPNSWTVANPDTSYNWGVGTTSGFATFPNGAAYFDDDDAGPSSVNRNARLISPVINLSTFTGAKLSFKYANMIYDQNSGIRVEVFNGNSWLQIFSSYGEVGTWTIDFNTLTYILVNYQDITNIDLTPYINSNFQLRFVYDDIGDYSYGAVIDDVLIESVNNTGPDANNILYVNQNVSGGNGAGDSWENAMPELADALKWAKQNESEWTTAEPLKIWVAEGTYKPMYSPTDDNFGNPAGRSNTFLIVKNVQLYGGFAGGETALEERDWKINFAILNGDIDNTPNDNSQNAYHVVASTGNVESARLDGFRIIGGKADNIATEIVNGISLGHVDGGGINIVNSSPSLANLVVSDNYADTYGGGISQTGSSSLTNVEISNNTGRFGGGIFNYTSTSTFTNVLISNNTSINDGGGVFNYSSSPMFTNVTITNNTASADGGGIFNYDSPFTAQNSILYGNKLNDDTISNLFISSSTNYTFKNSLVEGSGGSEVWNSDFGTDLGGNIDLAPLFIDPENADFSLQAYSPAVNSGNNSLFTGLDESTLDLGGNPRLFGTNIDMGAYEFQAEVISPDANNILYVNQNVSGGNGTGNSWENAMPELADALKWAKENASEWTTNEPLKIWVAEGTYKPMYSPADINFGNPDGRNNTFLMVRNVQLYGGFEGNETTLEARDWDVNETILSADIDNTPEDNSGNATHVVLSANNVDSSSMDGFTITGGNADLNEVLSVNSLSVYGGHGGGIYNYDSSFSIANSIVSDNSSTSDGGGIYNYNASVSMNNLTISNNTSIIGGGIYNNLSSQSITNSNISNNTSVTAAEGGIYNRFNTISITNTKISGNAGNGIVNVSSSLTIVNSTVTNNIGIGIYNESTSPKIYNSIIYGNGNNQSNVFNNNNNSLPDIQNSLVGGIDENNEFGNISGDPLFTDAANGDFSLQACSPAVNSGNNSLFDGLNENTLDLAGNPRLFGANIDMGAYEFQDEQIDYSLVTFENVTETYDGNAHSIEVANLPEGTTVAYEITNENQTTTTGNSATNAGVYEITATISGCGEPQEFNATLTIEKADAIITADATQTHTYDGNMHIVSASLNHVETALTYAPQQGYTNAGTYEITVSADETTNYNSASEVVTLIIENADWNPGGGGSGVTLPDETYTYNGTAQSVEVENLPAEATVTYTITDAENNTENGNSATNAGTYVVTALLQMPNYNDLTLTADLIINKATAIITSNDVQNHTYDGTLKNTVASLNHAETTLVYTPQQGYTDAGTYPITISAVETQNYLSVSKTIDLVIENADFEGIEFNDGEFTYDGIAHSIFVSGEPDNATVTYTGNGQTNAGTYTVSALIQMPNYNDLTLTAELIINKAEAIITSNDVQTHTYDGTVKNTVATLNHAETVLVYTPQQGYTDAGTYAITISAVETQNYLEVLKTIDLVIENADFEGIEFEDGEFTYDGMAHSIFISGEPENATVTYTNNGQTNAGTYTVSALILMPNYNDLTLTAELIINKAEAIITSNDVQTHTYDGTIKNTVASLNHAETALVYSPQQGYTDAGTYTITISAVETQNYLAVSKTIDLVIENADFEEIEFEDGEFTYDGIAHSIFVSGEPENATVTYNNNGQTNAGTYMVTALIQMPNYNDLTLTAELIINKAEAIITSNDVQTQVYDGTIKNTVANLNHAETVLVYAPQQGYTDAGTYPITISAVETQNYLAISKTIDLVIENADFDGIEFEDGEFTYDGITHSIFVSGEPENATVTYTGNGQTNAGTYTVSALIQMPNYNDLTLTAELIINKAHQTLTFNPIPVKHLENDVDFQLDASASSGLEVYYTFTFDTENPAATVTTSGWVELLTSGSIWITAHQDGNENYHPAVSVERELEIVSSNNSIISIIIHGDTIENPGNEIYYLIDCDDTSTSINVEIETETGASVSPGHSFTMDVPAPGIYRQIVTVTSQNGSVRNYEIIIEKRFNFNDIVVQKFDNVLLVNNNPENNGGYEFDAYEWFKNGALIGTGQYYSAGDNSNDTLDPNAVYHVRMRTTDGEWLSTCQAQIELRAAYSVKIAPNPVYSGNVIKVFADFPEDEMKNMSIKLFSMAGELILETQSSERITEIRLPGGMTSATYIVQVNTGKTIKNVQFLVK